MIVAACSTVACASSVATDGGTVANDAVSDGAGDAATDVANETSPPRDAPIAGSDTASNGIVYRAFALFTALDRIVFTRADYDRHTCSWIVIVSPSMGSALNITTPAGWSVGNGSRSSSVADCETAMLRSGTATADSASGQIEFTPPAGRPYPCVADVMFTLTFGADVETWGASGVPIVGACM